MPNSEISNNVSEMPFDNIGHQREENGYQNLDVLDLFYRSSRTNQSAQSEQSLPGLKITEPEGGLQARENQAPVLERAAASDQVAIPQVSGASVLELGKIEKNLHDSIEKIDPALAEKFNSFSSSFHNRAAAEGISVEDELNTYRALQKLVDAPEDSGAKLSQKDRTLMALDFMYHAADPSTIDQGQHGTCNAATIEERVITKQPLVVASMISEAALTGKWTAPDGKVIEIDARSLQPGKEEDQHPPLNGDRSLASKVFQVTALNDLAQRGEFSGDYLGRIVEYREFNEQAFMKLEVPEEYGQYKGLRTEAIQKELTRLTGDDTPNVIINTAKDKGKDKGVIHIESEQDLQKNLQEMKAANDLPAIISVYTSMPPFSKDVKSGHIVSITDIKQNADGSFQVFLDNQWGKSESGTTEGDDTGKDGWYTLSEIYNSTKPSAQAA